ncbi:galactosyltransferase-related protein [Pedobacter frigoris]|uniref:galactosyltransferase-related protein n=1 Tax=Pedobacter frigoris TaxID=2571272 RepID=UPI00292FF1B1|nr:galactosyltransferase-related protein [Pedobacter frigoris]
MILLSAQPDDYYFLWQLQLQLHNFSRLGVKQKNIHVLIGYDKKRGLRPYFKDFISTNKQAQFYTYPDERKNTVYLSSLRPYIIARHFNTHQWLENETVFYHDSDIIFNRLPDFRLMSADDKWYASETRSYTGVDYIKRTSKEHVFHEMCALMAVDRTLIEENDVNAGGAQYLLKNVPATFWERLEIDSEKVFTLLNDYNSNLGYCSKQEKIQAWCTDMWCLWWGALALGKQVAVHPELNFSWAHSPVQLEQQNPIIHYTGKVSDQNKHLFRKNDYSNCSPFYEDLRAIDRHTSSYTVVKEIRDYNESQFANRIDLTDVSFLIPVRIDSKERLENVYIITQYLHTHFNTNIILMEGDDVSKIDLELISKRVRYVFIKDDHREFHRTKYNNKLIGLAKTPYIALYDADVVFPIPQIMESIALLRECNCDMVYPYDGGFVGVGLLMKVMFSKLLDASLFESNQNKLNIGTKRSYGGCVFLNKEAYQKAGLENENLTSWGPDDIERWKRMLLLGYKIKRVPGNLYHLPHPRSLNSGYTSIQSRMKLTNEYLDICTMQKEELEKYVASWEWNSDINISN